MSKVERWNDGDGASGVFGYQVEVGKQGVKRGLIGGA
jgi:hypothetical protein